MCVGPGYLSKLIEGQTIGSYTVARYKDQTVLHTGVIQIYNNWVVVSRAVEAGL